eukprot:3882112-Rhodomonas_salina.1
MYRWSSLTARVLCPHAIRTLQSICTLSSRCPHPIITLSSPYYHAIFSPSSRYPHARLSCDHSGCALDCAGGGQGRQPEEQSAR